MRTSETTPSLGGTVPDSVLAPPTRFAGAGRAEEGARQTHGLGSLLPVLVWLWMGAASRVPGDGGGRRGVGGCFGTGRTGRFVARGSNRPARHALARGGASSKWGLSAGLGRWHSRSFVDASGPPHGLGRVSARPGEGVDANVRKATGRGDAYRLWVRGILRGVNGTGGMASVRPLPASAGGWRRKAGNHVNPRTGCGMQQARGGSMRSKPSRW